jgi:hypothetical protein
MTYEDHAAVLRNLQPPFDLTWVDTGSVTLEPGTTDCVLVGGLVFSSEESPARPQHKGAAVLPVIKGASDHVLSAPPVLAAAHPDHRGMAAVDLSHDQKFSQMVNAGDRGAKDLQEIIVDAGGVIVNVDLVEAPLSPRQRKREAKKGRRIALTVQVRQPKTRPVGRNGTANYSHRFEVRGHYMHFPGGTKLADADPAKLSFVPGRGFVRKVWCPPHVKGPQDKPLVPKVRVVAEDAA